jgi:hypothetical protein
MNPGVGNLDIYRGDTKRWKCNLWADIKRTVPTDLTGVVANASIRDKALGGSYETALTCVITLPNIIDVSLTAEQSRNLPAVGVWDLQLTYPSGDVYTVMKGAVIVTQDVTRPPSVVVQVARAR